MFLIILLVDTFVVDGMSYHGYKTWGYTEMVYK